MGSDFLFTTPGFLTGVARLMDLFGELDDYNFAPNPGLADAIATRVDWQTVGADMWAALKEYNEAADAHQLLLFDNAGHQAEASF